MTSMIDDLLDPSSLPDETQDVSLVQTHISIVLIADRFVYKIKKPVNFGFLDFSTLEKRHHYCEQEVVLNRRLSKGLYWGVLPVVYDGERYRLGGDGGEIVEYAVKMRRIPDKLLMKSLLQRGELRDGHLAKIARTLARFHGTTRNSPEIDAFGEPERFKINTDENFEQTRAYIGVTIQKQDFHAIQTWTADFYRANRGIFLNRIRAKRIRDCHGDLHMEHICLEEDVSIFDCIEFNDRFRYCDTLSDIAFLLMDLEFHGGEEYSKRLWRLYGEMAGEANVDPLLTFYKVYRAYVRGKATSFQLDDERIRDDKKIEATQTARRYFQLARSYIEGGHEMREPFVDFMNRELGPDAVLIACGLPATYKTETTEVIADIKGYTMLRTDIIRLEVLKCEDIFDEKVASNMEKRHRVYDEMFRIADELAARGEGVILDATFIKQDLRRRAAELAARHHRTLVIQQTCCPQEVSLRRISQRTKEQYESNALTEQAYLDNKRRFEPVDLDDLKGCYPDLHIVHVMVDTASDLKEEWFIIGKTTR